VWEDAPLVMPEPAGQRAGTGRSSWLVPDTRTGSLELYRITTPPFLLADGTTRSRADFYEFYWSDIMEGTTVEHLRAWLFGLLLRWPYQVPPRVKFAWYLLWLCTLVALLSAVAGAGSLLPGSWLPTWQLNDDIARWIGGVLCVIGAAAGISLLRQRYAQSLRSRQESQEELWRRGLANVFSDHSSLTALGLIWIGPILLATFLFLLAPWASILTLPALLLLVSFFVGWGTQAFLVPYFGDVAHYVRAAPNTVARRALVRERGLQLLRALHGGPDDADRYDRIVVVAHSLGSIVAYDILNHYWAECGPNSANPPAAKARAALEALDAYVTKHRGQPDFDLDQFRSLQGAVSRALAEEKAGWRISDLITLGSPLSHAEFLLARDDVDLANRIDERQLPICPPGPADDSGSIFVERDGVAREKWLPHHATAFAATRWTNIYDPHPWRWNIYCGDIISGRLGNHRDNDLAGSPPGAFGEGIRDIAVEMRRPCPILGDRCFTHTIYWSQQAQARRLDGAAACGPKAHIEVLREAIAFADWA